MLWPKINPPSFEIIFHLGLKMFEGSIWQKKRIPFSTAQQLKAVQSLAESRVTLPNFLPYLSLGLIFACQCFQGCFRPGGTKVRAAL